MAHTTQRYHGWRRLPRSRRLPERSVFRAEKPSAEHTEDTERRGFLADLPKLGPARGFGERSLGELTSEWLNTTHWYHGSRRLPRCRRLVRHPDGWGDDVLCAALAPSSHDGDFSSYPSVFSLLLIGSGQASVLASRRPVFVAAVLLWLFSCTNFTVSNVGSVKRCSYGHCPKLQRTGCALELKPTLPEIME